MYKNFLSKIIYLIFLYNEILNESNDNNSIIINQIFNIARDGSFYFTSLKMSNNDIILFSLLSAKIDIFGLKYFGDFMFVEGSKYFKTLDINLAELNAINVFIEDQEYPLICSSRFCKLVDYESGKTYSSDLLKFLNEDRSKFIDGKSPSSKYFKLININNRNQILFNIIYDGTIVLGITNILSKALSEYQNCYFYYDKNKIKAKEIEKLSCFITEKNLIECFYLNSITYNYDVIIFNETLNYLDIIEIDSYDNNDYSSFINCIHLYEEVGIFTYYKDYLLILQVNELIFNGEKYSFNIKHNISITLNNKNYYNDFLFIESENLMKISDKKFSYIFSNHDSFFFDEEQNYYIILAIIDLYGENNENLIVKYYKINANIFGNEINGIFDLNTLIYKSFIGIGIIGSFDNTKSFLIIIGNTNHVSNQIVELNIKPDYEWKINNYFEITINNNIFGYEVFYAITSLPNFLLDLIFYSVNNKKRIELNQHFDYNDSIIIDYSNIDIRIDENPVIGITAMILEPDYEKSLSLCEKFDIYGENQTEYYERKIIDKKLLNFRLNFFCFENCGTCEYAGYSIDNQKCLSCKGNNLCFKEDEGNCYNIYTSNYNFNTDSSNHLSCVADMESNTEESTEHILNNNYKNIESTFNSSENVQETITANENDIEDSIEFTESSSEVTEINTNEATETYSSETTEANTNELSELYNNDETETNDSDTPETNTHEAIETNSNEAKGANTNEPTEDETSTTQKENEGKSSEKNSLETLETSENNKDKLYEELINSIPDSVNEAFEIFYNKIVNGSFDEEINDEIIIYKDNMTIQATTSSKQKYYIDNGIKTNFSIIDFSECEKKLGLDKPLIIIKSDINKNDSYAPQVEYIAINPYTYEIIDLSICDGTKINVYVAFNISDDNLNLYATASSQGYNIFNPSDPFYNDICTPFKSGNKTDVLIKDRKKDFYKDYSFCEEGCNFDNLNLALNKAKCDCEIKKEIKTETKFSSNKLLKKFYQFSSYSNLQAIICYKLVFSKNLFENINYGCYILLVIGFLFILSSIGNLITYSRRINSILETILKQQKSIFEYNEKKNFENVKNMNEKSLRIIKKKRNKIKKNSLFKPLKIENLKINNNKNGRENNIKEKREILDKRGSKKGIKNNLNSPPKIRNSSRNYHQVKNEEKTIEALSSSIKSVISVYRKLNNNASRNIVKTLSNRNRSIIEIIISNIEKGKRHIYFKDEELNSLPYKSAIEIDNRSYFQYYLSLLKSKHLIIFTFIAKDDYNLFLLKFGFFLISFALFFTINAIFFSDDSIHRIYESKGKYNFLYEIPKILYSAIISTIINMILKKLSLSQNNILKIRQNINIEKANEESNNIKKCLKIKFILFVIIGFILLFFFWYFVSCFCCVFTNSQITLIKDTLISYTLSLLYPFGLNLLPGILRIPSLRKSNRKIMYIISRIIAFL